MKILCFDTETTGLIKKPQGKWGKDPSFMQSECWPHVVEIAWILADDDRKTVLESSYIISPDNWEIPQEASAIHSITTDFATANGIDFNIAMDEFMQVLPTADIVVGHNVEFDIKVVCAELYRFKRMDDIQALKTKNNICTKNVSTNYCKIPAPWGGNNYKWATLSELYRKLFTKEIENAHRAMSDVKATLECFYELEKRGVIHLV
jgi:DNA polymerase III subunit epsilon